MKTALVAIAKNEDNYLKEWVDYNIKIGFDDIYICQNNWRYNKNDIHESNVYFLECDGHRMQNPCYEKFLDEYYDKYDFIAFFDIDEFLYIKNGNTINEFLEEYKDVSLLYINWRMFGDNGLDFVENDNYSCLNRFTKCDDKLWPLGKCIINTKKEKNTIRFYNPHIPIYSINPLSLPTYTLPSKQNMNRPWMWKIEDMYKFPWQPIEIWHFRNKTYQECYDRKFGQDDVQHEASQFEVTSNIDAFNREYEKSNRNIINVEEIK